MWFSKKPLFAILLLLFFLESKVNGNHVNDTSLFCLLKANASENCHYLEGHDAELRLLYNDVPHELREKLLLGSLADLTINEIIKLPKSLIYFVPINKFAVLPGNSLAALLIEHEDDTLIVKKVLQSVLTERQRFDFLSYLDTLVQINDKTLDVMSETVYKWNFDIKDGKLKKMSNICGHALARLWAPYVLTRTKTSIRLLNLLAGIEKNPNDLDKNCTQIDWKDLPKSVRRTWSFLAANQSYPNSLKQWTVKQIARYNFLLTDFDNNELRLIPFDETSKMALQNIDFDYSQTRFLFSLLMENSTLKNVKFLYPKVFFKLSPSQMNQFEPEEWAEEKIAISLLDNKRLSYAAAKQIFNKIASHWLSSKVNPINGWTSDDLRHLPLLYTQPASSFLKFCAVPPSAQSLIAVDSDMLTDRQAFYLSGCSSMLSFHKNDQKLILALKYILKAVPVSSLLNIEVSRNITYQVGSHLVSSINGHNLPLTLHLLNIINPVKKTIFVEEMLKNENNVLFEQLSPMDISGPIFDIIKQLYSKYSDRIDKLPKHLLNAILENNELLIKWTGDESVVTNGLFNGYTCNFIKKMNSVKFIISIYNYNAYLKRNGKVFPKNLQTCVAKAFVNYLKLKSKFSADLSTSLYLEEWEIEAVQGFVLTTLPVDVILNSTLKDNILYAIGRLSFPELMIATRPEKLTLMVNQYITHALKNRSNLSYEHLYTLGNLTHFIPAMYLNLIDEAAFKFFIEAGLFDTRICVGSDSKDGWANLIVKAFGNLKHWSSDILVMLSDLLIVFNQNQLNSIPITSRLNSADIIRTKYVDEIEWFSHDIPFYKACGSILGDQYTNFTATLSVLTDFYLASTQSQLHTISSINYNHQYEEILKSSEAKPKIVKPTVLFPTLGINEAFNIFSPDNFIRKFFTGKEKQDVNPTISTKENSQITTTAIPITVEFNSTFSSSKEPLTFTESITVVEITNSTIDSILMSTTDLSDYSQNTKNAVSDRSTENVLDVTFVPLQFSVTNHSNIELNLSRADISADFENINDKTQLMIGGSKFNLNVIHGQEKVTSLPVVIKKSEYSDDGFTYSQLDLKNRKKFFDSKKHGSYDSSNDTFSSDIVELHTIGHNASSQNYGERRKRSFEPFLITDIQISCEALKIIGPASVTSMRFDSIVRSMNDEELEECVDLLGSFDINPDLASYIWSKTKNKTALHTYGSVLSGLSFDDVKTLDLNINSPWSLELINLLSKYVTTLSIRKEITKQFMANSKVNMPSHLWGSFGSLICQLKPSTFKTIMANRELFWKTSPAFNTINTCDTPCMKHLASIAVSVIGPSNLWKTAEVERLGVTLAGINITQWQLLLDLNSEALEGLSSNTVKCLSEQQIKLMNESHIKYLTPKAVRTLLETHSELLDLQIRKTLLKLVTFEIKADWQSTPVILMSNVNEKSNHFKNYNSSSDGLHAFENTNNIPSNEMQADSKATTNRILHFSTLSAIALLLILK